MECPTCQTEIPIGQQFCPHCGSKVELDFDTIQQSIDVDQASRRGDQLATAFQVAIAVFILLNAVVWLWNDLYTPEYYVDVADIPAASAPSGQIAPLPPVKLKPVEHAVTLPLPHVSQFSEQRLGFRRPGPIRDILMKERGVTPEIHKSITRGLDYIVSKIEMRRRGFVGMVSAQATMASKARWADTALTGLAALALLGDGHVWVPDGEGRQSKFGEFTKKAIHWLVYNQQPSGQIGPSTSPKVMLQHGIAALAVVEAYAMSGDADLGTAAQLALDFIAKTQHEDGGWYYRPDPTEEKGEVSLMGWQIMALIQGQQAHLRVDPNVLKKASAYLDKMTRKGNVYDYEIPRGNDDLINPRGTTAVALMSRLAMGQSLGLNHNKRAERLLMDEENLPYWPERWKSVKSTKGRLDMYYIFHGSMAMARVGGKSWEIWNENLAQALINRQRPGTGARGGYWNNYGRWGQFGGRVYSTALAVLSLEAPYRYID